MYSHVTSNEDETPISVYCIWRILGSNFDLSHSDLNIVVSCC
jgi:hypothetical protein